MADKILNTRIALKIDTLTSWNSSSLPLKKGELAIATTAATAGTGLTEPVVMIKVGEDGVKTFKDLPWNFYAKASDVLAACKTEASLTAYINNVINSAGLATGTNLTAIANRVTQAETDIDALEAKVGSETVAKQISDAIAALKLADTYEKKGEAAKVQTALDTYKDSNDGVIAAIKDGTTIDSFKDVENALAGKQATGDYATKTEAQGYANAKDSAIAAAKTAGDNAKAAADNAQADVDALAGKVGTVASGTTVVEMINEANADIASNASDIDAINNTSTGILAQAKKYTDDVKDTILGEGIKDTFDTLVEIQNWIEGDGVNATELSTAIADEAKLRADADTALGARIDGVDATATAAMPKAGGTFTGMVTLKDDPTVDLHAATKKYVDTKASTASGAASTAQARADEAYTLASSKATMTEVNTAISNAGHAAAADLSAHTGNTTVHITAAERTKWNAAEQNAKTYADGLNSSMTSRVDGIEDIAETAVQSVEVSTGLKANKSGTKVTIDIDDSVTFVFDCGDSTN